ncbi:Sodium/glucose cotransporter [compost metagenome]
MDVYLPYIKPKSTEKQSVRFGRITGVIIIVLGIVCTGLLTLYSHKPIFIYLMNAYGYFTPGIAAMFLLGILWKRTTHTGAVAAGLLTIPLSLAIEYGFPDMPFFNRTGIVFWACMLCCVLVSLVTKPKPAEELVGLIWTRDSLSLPLEERKQQRGLRNPFIWWAIITIIVLYFYIRYA